MTRHDRELRPTPTQLNVDPTHAASNMYDVLKETVDDQYPQMIEMARTIFNDCLEQHRPYGVAIATTYESLRGYTKDPDMSFGDFENMFWSNVKGLNQKIASQGGYYNTLPLQATFIVKAKTDSLSRMYKRGETEPFVVDSTQELGKVALSETDGMATDEANDTEEKEGKKGKEIELWREPSKAGILSDELSQQLAGQEKVTVVAPQSEPVENTTASVALKDSERQPEARTVRSKERRDRQPYTAVYLEGQGESRLYNRPDTLVADIAITPDAAPEYDFGIIDRGVEVDEDGVEKGRGQILIDNENGQFLIDDGLLIQTYDRTVSPAKQPKRRSTLKITSMRAVIGKPLEITYAEPADNQLVERLNAEITSAHVLVMVPESTSGSAKQEVISKRSKMWDRAVSILEDELAKRSQPPRPPKRKQS